MHRFETEKLILYLRKEVPAQPRTSAKSPRFDLPSATVGGLAYFALSQTMPESAAVSFNEIGSVGAGITAGAIGALSATQSECDREHLLNDLTLETTASGGGFLAGLGIAGTTGGALVLSAADMGITFGCTLTVGLWARMQKMRAKRKLCPGLNGGKQHLGQCTQRICGECHCLFFPNEASEKIGEKKWFTVYELFSFLHFQGLSVLDSICLLIDDRFDVQWKDTRNGPRFRTESLSNWLENHEKMLAELQGAGEQLPSETRREIIDQLNPNS